MASLTDWMARTLFVDEDYENELNALREKNQQALQRQSNEGKIDAVTYSDLTRMNTIGTQTYNEELGRPGAVGFAFAIPGWVWLAAGLALFWWLGGFVWVARKTKGALSR